MESIMRKRSLRILTSLALYLPLTSSLQAALDNPTTTSSNLQMQKQAKLPFSPFTGKVTKNKVRIRLSPQLDGSIVKELSQGDLVLVNGEEEDFYAIKPPENTKGYIFRTFVLDGVIEGNRVNVRLDPSTESPVIAQLTSGDKVTGKVSPLNNKWYEIKLPETAQFFVSRDYIQKVGDANLMATLQRKQMEVNSRLEKAYLDGKEALKGPFPDISYSLISNQYDSIIRDFPEFEEQKARAKELFAGFKDEYLKKKIEYLETHSDSIRHAEDLKKEKNHLEVKLKEQEKRLQELQQKVTYEAFSNNSSSTIPLWVPVEQGYYAAWAERNGHGPMSSFYREELDRAVELKGMIEPYTRNVKNKPGDYLLVSSNGRPIAFLYSTLVNLQDYVGTEVSIKAASRPNYDFAFPAYFVLGAQ